MAARWGIEISKPIRPAPRAVINAQDLDRLLAQPIGNDEGRSGYDKLARPRDAPRSSHFRALRQQGLHAMQNTIDDPSRCRAILGLNVAPQRREIGKRRLGPDRRHFVLVVLGIGSSLALPHDSTQALSWSCGISSPRSAASIACLIPATCHSLTSRYSLIASAARNERLRPVLLASFSRRFLALLSTRTVNVAEVMFLPCA